MFDLPSYLMGSGSGGGGGGSSTLADLTDVDISNPADGQTLVYNATSGKWENGAGGGSGGVLVVHEIYDEQTETSTLDKTWQEIHDADFAVIRVEGNDRLYVCPMVHTSYFNGVYYAFFCMTQPGESVVPYQELNAYGTNTANGYPVYFDK